MLPNQRGATQARVRQQLRSTLRDLAATRSTCSHFDAAQIGAIEAALRRGGWEYRTSYRCATCGACFVEVHTQSAPRDAVG
jgi:hypothetical protein